MADEVVGYRQNLDHSVRCDGCGMVVGKGSPYGSTVYKVTDGPITGTFHSRECYARNVEKQSTNNNSKEE